MVEVQTWTMLENNTMWQHFWPPRSVLLPWVKFVMGSNGKVVQVWCKVCFLIDGKNKLLVAKLDSLWNHVGCCKVLTTMSGINVGEHYFLKSNAHVVNEKFYFAKGPKIMLQWVIHDVV
jgi:hypothetical protein